MKSIGELKDQLNDAQAALAEEEQELRRAEMLVEKEAGSAAQVTPPASMMAAMQIRPA